MLILFILQQSHTFKLKNRLSASNGINQWHGEESYINIAQNLPVFNGVLYF